MSTVVDFDLAVIGGGVNGCGIARDTVGRGASVVLFEQGDLAGATSSASTKLVHGGLRYLEQYEFRLVREALLEREVLWGIAPHIIWPLRFVLPHHKGLRPRWLLRLGLLLYDHIGGRKRLSATRSLDLRRDAAGAPLKAAFRHAFEYSDAWVQDARLVVLNALDAAERGADIRVRTRVVGIERLADHWRIVTRDGAGDGAITTARVLVNAGGPWVGEVLGLAGANAPAHVRLVQGSHIVTRKLFDHDRAYIFQNGDGRIIFAIPYEDDFTLIGTTDGDYRGDPAQVAATDADVAYLCAAASEYFERPVSPADVIWRYAGVRPLIDDGSETPQEASRDYVLDLDAHPGVAPLLSVFGGKITTYRRLAESALEALGEVLDAARQPPWTATAPLPGGAFPRAGAGELVARLGVEHPYLDRVLARRLVRAYGLRAWQILEGANAMNDLGEVFGAGLTAREVVYLMDIEWARTASDVLWRRGKLGLRIDAGGVARLEAFMATRLPPRPAASTALRSAA